MWFDATNYWVKMVLTLAIFPQLIALKGLWKVFENRQKKSLKVFEFFWSWRLRTLIRYHVLNGSTHVKMHKLYQNLQQTCSNAVPTTCQQDVFALLVPSLLISCQRLVGNLLQGCWAQQTYYKLFQQLVIVLQFNNLSTSCEWQPCSNLIK
jgi:hypothetical protein